MKLTHLPSEFQKALPILEKLKAAGFEAYFVGGCVRDVLLDKPIHDIDIATSSYPEETKQIFPRTADIGIEHGTVLVLEDDAEYEVTTFRTEAVYVDYRRPSQVSFVRSLHEDLKRRDFTINAFALDASSELVDLFNGLQDLEQETLRAVGQASERFNEDALRIMRGLRFSASLGFSIEPETFQAMQEHAHLLTKISVERLFIECDKLLLGRYWKKGVTSLLAIQAFHYLPDLQASKERLQHFMAIYDDRFVFSTSPQAWAALLAALEIRDVKSFLKKWKASNHFKTAVQEHIESFHAFENGQLDKRLLYRFGKAVLLSVDELWVASGHPSQKEQILALEALLPIHCKQEIEVDGGILIRELGLMPGPDLGKILTAVEMAIVDGKLSNQKPEILAYVRKELASE